jgi:hypothetical protein
MPLSDIISISVTAETAGVSAAGFGKALLLSAEPAWAERTRTYTEPDGVADDFDTTGPTYLAALAMFSQNPRPESVIVGRLVNKPTQKWTLDLGSAGIQNSTRYRIQVVDALGNTQNADFTTDASATEAELMAGLAAAFNALVGPTATAVNTGPGTSLVITADTAGDWHALAVIDPNGQYDAGVYLSIVQDHADPGVAADLTAILNENDTWFAIYSPFNSEAYAGGIATWAEANERIFVGQIQDSATVTAAAGGTDLADDFSDSAWANTALLYHPNPAKFADAALLGKCLPLDPGSETWKFKTLAGVDTYPITSTHRTNLEAKNCNYYYTVGGVSIVSQGVTSSGEFIDVTRFIFWFKARLAERIFGRLANAKKIPMTDSGIAVIEAEVRAQLKEGVEAGGFADDPAPTVSVPRASAISTADRTARNLRQVKFTATLAGAIHKLIPISGTVSA